LIPAMAEQLYGQTEVLPKTNYNWANFSKLAFDFAKAAELNEQTPENKVFWQFLRVSKTFQVYLVSILKMWKNHFANVNEYEKTIRKWKVEAQKQFLIARWRRFVNFVFL